MHVLPVFTLEQVGEYEEESQVQQHVGTDALAFQFDRVGRIGQKVTVFLTFSSNCSVVRVPEFGVMVSWSQASWVIGVPVNGSNCFLPSITVCTCLQPTCWLPCRPTSTLGMPTFGNTLLFTP